MKSLKSSTNRKIYIEDVIEEYRSLVKEYSLPTDDELTRKLQRLQPTDRNLIILFIASEYKYGIFARVLGTNIKYGKSLIEGIRQKIIDME